MGLLDRLKLNKTKDFFEWLDLILKNELNSEIKAINFNLYEDTDNKWSVELVGTFSFDKDNDDWACDEVFTTRDQPFVIECESDWELVETFFISLVNEYLSSGKYAGKLKEYQAIGIGFVDGDLYSGGISVRQTECSRGIPFISAKEEILRQAQDDGNKW